MLSFIGFYEKLKWLYIYLFNYLFDYLDVHCPTLTSIAPPMSTKIQGTRMGHKAEFECPDGYRLEGMRVLSCQYNGQYL